MSTTASKIVWLQRFLYDLGIVLTASIPLYCDNQSSIKIPNNPIFRESTNHIEIDCDLVHHHYLADTIILPSTKLPISSPKVTPYCDISI